MLVADIPQENQVGKPTGSYSVAAWFEYCAPDFTLSNVNKIFGAKKLIEAKAALKGSKGSKGSFTLLVEGLDIEQPLVDPWGFDVEPIRLFDPDVSGQRTMIGGGEHAPTAE